MGEVEDMRRPQMSVCMAVRNEGRFIEQALTDLLTQDIDYTLVEFLIADGCSDDGTLETILDVCARYPGRRVTVFRNPLRLQYAAINRMVQLSHGRYVQIVDGHSRYRKDFLSNNLQRISVGDAGIVGGLWETRAANDGAIAQAIAGCLSTRLGVGNARYRLGVGDVESDTAPFPCVVRSVFERVGLFREEMLSNADLELFSRARANGFRLVLDSRIRSTYFARDTLIDIARKMYRDGRWHASHLESVKLRHLAPLIFAVVNIALIVGGIVWPLLWGIWAALAGLYLGIALASAFGPLPYGMRPGFLARLWMLFCYPVFHWSYGLGWVSGMFSRDTREARRQAAVPAPRINTPLGDPLETVFADGVRRLGASRAPMRMTAQAAE